MILSADRYVAVCHSIICSSLENKSYLKNNFPISMVCVSTCNATSVSLCHNYSRSKWTRNLQHNLGTQCVI